jgi:hypothetical protein
MKRVAFFNYALGCLLTFSALTLFGSPQKQGEICSDPAAKCSSSKYQFSDYELSFRIPQAPDAKLGGYASTPFYAVILKSVKAVSSQDADDCSFVSESERLKVQAIFPERKVFASRFQCPEQTLLYTNTNQDYNFLAIYAGKTKAQANKVLTKAKAGGQYPSANVRRMQLIISVE